MSKLITLEIPADTSTFEKSLTDRAAEFERISAQAREKGAIHHRFGIGEGFVQIVDEWLSAEAFGEFFADPALQEFIASVGGDTSAELQVRVSEATTLQS